ncbi:MAG: peptidyl-prolyl cis-trans isomerase [Nitrospiraceae bacterium]|nr:MAG: peptidyl-prolyl cis-trans isomerase [Nitrospiraceae bacterium]
MKSFHPATVVLVAAALVGCASAPPRNSVLAYVDGDPLTRKDLEYALEVAHRREGLSTARELDVPRYVEKLIDDRLIVQEARRMGIDREAEIREKVDAYILRESVVHLYSEEVLERVFVTDDEISDYYRKNYERFIVDIIETESEEEARTIVHALNTGRPFEEFSDRHPASVARDEKGDYVVTRKSAAASVFGAIEKLSPGEVSGVVGHRDRHYLFRLIRREEAPEDGLDLVRVKIESEIRKQKVDERSGAYLARLRQDAPVTVDENIIGQIRFDEGSDDRDRWLKDTRTLASVGDVVLAVGEFVAMLPQSDDSAKEKVLNRWLDFKIVDREALSRHYEDDPDFRAKLNRYENELIKNAFLGSVIASRITIADEEVEEYYEGHRDEFLMPAEYRVQQITLNSREEAEEVLKSLGEGAQFSWIARTKSKDAYAALGGVMEWKRKDEFENPVRDIIDTLNPGDTSPVLAIDGMYRIIRLMEKSAREVWKLEKVKDQAFRAVYREKFRDRYNEALGELRTKADIELNEKAIQHFERMFKE